LTIARTWQLPILRRLAVAVGVALAGALLGVAVTASTSPVYEATALVLPRGVLDGVPVREDAAQLAEVRGRTLAAIAARRPAVAEAAAELGGGITVDDVFAYATVEEGSWLVVIHARAPSGGAAAAVANGLADSVIAGGVASRVVERAEVPATPMEPRPLLFVLVGTTVGLSVGLAALALRRGSPASATGAFHRHVPSGAPWVVGLVLIVLIVAAVGLRAPQAVIQLVAGAAACLTLLRPSVGIAILAVVLPMRDIELVGPLDMRLALTAALAFGVTLDVLARRSRLVIQPWLILVAGYVAVSSLATLPALTGLEGVRALEAVVQLSDVASVTVLVIAASIVFQWVHPQRIVVLGLLSAAFVGLVVLIQWLSGADSSGPVSGFLSQHVTESTRAIGPYNNSNYLGMFGALGIAICAGLWVAGGYPRTFLLLIAGLCAASVALSFSRAAILSTIVGLLGALWIANRRAAIVVSVVGALVLVIGYPLFLETRLERTFGGYSTLATLSLAESDTMRGNALQAGIDLTLARPFFGGGFAQFQFLSPQFVNAAPVTFPHNEYLRLLAEQGIVGSLPLLAAVTLAARGLWAQRAAAAYLLPVAITYAVGAVFVEPLASFQTSGLAWLLVGAVISAAAPLTAARG
jgi:O-antigen ligase/capsular polysaccharide biosynthesis protein